MGVQDEYVSHVERPMGGCKGRVDFVSGHRVEGACGDYSNTELARLTLEVLNVLSTSLNYRLVMIAWLVPHRSIHKSASV